MNHISLSMKEMPIEILEIESINPLISKCQIKVCYVGDEPNRNKSIITKDVAKELAKTLGGSPIVGFYNEANGDFEEHNRVIDISNGKFQIKDTTRPYGFVSINTKVWFQWFTDDGVPHEYLCCEGYIWTGQYPESQRIIEKGNNHSMELDEETLDAFWTKDINGKAKFFIINEAIMSKLCILGEDVEPCFEGASITSVQFSFEDDFKQKLFSFMEQMQEILSNEGGTPVLNTYAVDIGDALWNAIYDYLYNTDRDCEYSINSIYEEDSQKFVILRNRKDSTYYRLNFSLTEEGGFQPEGELTQVAPDFKPVGEEQFALADVEAFEVEFKQKYAALAEEPVAEEVAVEDSEPAEPVVEEKEPVIEDDNSKAQYNLEEIPEYQDLLSKYSVLESKVEELQATINALTTEKETLTNERDTLAAFKLKIDRENKQKLINDTFYMLSDDLKKDCVDNIDTYSFDEIEAKLSVLCVRNKVSFDLDREDKGQVYTLNLDNVNNDDSNIPEWVKRVQEVQKEINS